MTEPPVQDDFEYWFEVGLLTVGMIIGLVMGIIGVLTCTPYHPCPVYAQLLYGIGWSVMSMFGNAIIMVWFLFAGTDLAKRFKK